MPIDFPDDPDVGQQFSAGGQTWVWTGSVWSAFRGGPVVQYGGTAPENAVDGLIWFNTSNGRTYVYFSNAWIDTTNTSAISTSVLDNSAGDAFTVTQQGAGRALVVEGSTSVTGTLNATTLQQSGSAVALDSSLTSGLAAKADKAAGYLYNSTVYFTANGTFTKATYPWLRAVRFRIIGGGGGGAGAGATGAGQVSGGGSGGGAAYVEGFITNIAGLSSSETITVGTGGAGGSGFNSGSSGGSTTIFGYTAGGGGGGGAMGSAQVPSAAFGDGGGGGTGTLGSLASPSHVIFRGQGGTAYTSPATNRTIRGQGGASHLGGGAAGSYATNANGIDGTIYGGGGNNGVNQENQATTRTGGAGAPGLVIVELFA